MGTTPQYWQWRVHKDSNDASGNPPHLREVAFLAQGGDIPFAVAIGSANSHKPRCCQ